MINDQIDGVNIKTAREHVASLLVECRQKIQEIGNVASKSGLLLVSRGGREGITK